MNLRNNRSAESVARYWGKTLADRDWYSIKNISSDEAEIRIYDVIGWPYIEADMFVNELDKIDASHITVAINSPGGDVFDGVAIYNALRMHPAEITTRNDGLAASISGYILLAGDEVQIVENAYFMMHQPWALAVGDYRDLAKQSDLLKRIGAALGKAYMDKAGLKAGEVQDMMDEETWFIGQELVDKGLADSVVGGSGESASFDLGMFNHTPEGIRATKTDKDKVFARKELEKILRDAGLSRNHARGLVLKGYDAIDDQREAGIDSDNDQGIQALIETLNSDIPKQE